MKIAFLSRYQGKINRGAEVFVEELAKRLALKHQVDILVGKDSDSLLKIIKGGYDIVIPINGRWQSLVASVGRLFCNYKLLITGHSGLGKDDIWNLVVTNPDIFIVLTEAIKSNWRIKWLKNLAFGTKVIKIPDGVDIDKFKPQGSKLNTDLPKPIILSVGALVWYKHHEKIIDALAILSKGSLLIVGDGPERNNLNKLAKKKLKNRFKIITFPYEQIPSLYRSADLFTLPSWSRESFGIVYLEAMACGLPVVAPDDQSRREIVGDAGILVDVSNKDSYAKAIERALEKDWKNKPRKRAEKFSWDKIANSYDNIVQEIVLGNG